MHLSKGKPVRDNLRSSLGKETGPGRSAPHPRPPALTAGETAIGATPAACPPDPRLYSEMVSLGRAHERRALMAAECARAGIRVTLYDAVDMAVVPYEAMLLECRPEGPWGVFHHQNMACTLSHVRIWERFLTTDAAFCLVLEDDVFIAPDLGRWLADLSWWPDGADIVKLERWRSNRLKVLLDQPGHGHLGRRVQRMRSRHSGSAGYILTRDTAEGLLAAAPYGLTIDQLLFNANASTAARGLALYQITPALIEQGNEPPPRAPRTETRLRPAGLALLRQKLKRGYHEIAYPLSALAAALTGRARAVTVPYQASTLTDAPPAGQDH